jgi:hypothetical protein
MPSATKGAASPWFDGEHWNDITVLRHAICYFLAILNGLIQTRRGGEISLRMARDSIL